METPCVELKPHLPNLPQCVEGTGEDHAIPSDSPLHATPLDLIHRLLVYPPQDRMTAADVLKHPWFVDSDGEPLLLPVEKSPEGLAGPTLKEWNGHPSGYWLESIFGSGRGG